MEVTPRTRTRIDMSGYGNILAGMPSLPVKFSGMDLSLTSSGIATIQYGRIRRGLLETLHETGRNKGKPTGGTPEHLKGVERLDWLEQSLHCVISDPAPEIVALEGYSFASKGSRAHSTGEWGGIARLLLHRRGTRTIVFPPKSVKKFITGNGNAEKTEVVLALSKRYGIDEPQNDKADACVLAIMAACIARPGCLPLTKFQHEALAAVEEI